MLEQTPHQTAAIALEDTVCLEVSRDDITVLLEQKPHCGHGSADDVGATVSRVQKLVRIRATRNPNEVIEEKENWGEKIADAVAHFGGSWTLILVFIAFIGIWALINVQLRGRAWDPYPFILLNLFLSMLAAIQAPVILMSQNRQDIKDRLRGELDYDVNRRAEAKVHGVDRKLIALDEKM
jgi:CRP/FNR family transcriptional regulator, cyclic AMP receptor protein